MMLPDALVTRDQQKEHQEQQEPAANRFVHPRRKQQIAQEPHRAAHRED